MAHQKLRPFFRALAVVNHVVLVLLILGAIAASLSLAGCTRAARADQRPDPKLAVPALPAPRLPGPAPEKTRTAHRPSHSSQGGYVLPVPTPFIYGEEITPPPGCLDLRKRGGTC